MFSNFTMFEFWRAYNNKNYVVLYKVIDGANLIEPIIHKNGLREYEGFDLDAELYNGYGAYTTYDLNVAIDTCKQVKSPIIVAYALKNQFNNFVVFDNNIRNLYKELSWMALSPKEMIEKLVEPEQLKIIGNYIRNCQDLPQEYRSKGMDYFSTMPPKGGKQAKLLCDALNVANRKKGAGIFIESDILKTRIRGYVFDGYKNKKAVVVRDFGSIIPVQYSLDCGKTWLDNEVLKSEDTYKGLIVNSVFPLYEYGHLYDNYDVFEHCPSNGFSKVSGQNGCNFMGVRSHRHLFPVDIEGCNGFGFMISSNRIEFNLKNYRFILVKEDGYSLFAELEGQFNHIGYDLFCGMIKHICPEKPFYDDNYLKDLIGIGY